MLVLPWLFPFAVAPSPAVLPWLFAMACAMGLLLLERGPQPMEILAAWWVAAAISAAIGLLQYAGIASHVTPWIANADPGVAFGNLRQRNQFATLCNMGLLALLYYRVLNPPTGAGARGATFMLIALMVAANAASGSRTGLLQLALISLLLGYWGIYRQTLVRQLIVCAWMAYCLAAFTLPTLFGLDATHYGILSRLHEAGAMCGSRLTLWGNVLDLLRARPWTGWGWGELDYAHFVTIYPAERFCEILDNAHNLPLHLAVELGLPLALLVCSAAAWWLWHRAPWRERVPVRQAAWAILGLILVHSMLEYPLWYGPFQIALVLSVQMLRRGVPAPMRPTVHTGLAMRRLTLLTGLAVIAYTAWDYQRVRQIYLPPDQRAAEYRDHTLEKAKQTRLFHKQALFAEYGLTETTPQTAPWLYDAGLELLHYSPEASVVEKLTEAAIILGRHPEAQFFRVRYQAAYPGEYQRWLQRRTVRRVALPITGGMPGASPE